MLDKSLCCTRLLADLTWSGRVVCKCVGTSRRLATFPDTDSFQLHASSAAGSEMAAARPDPECCQVIDSVGDFQEESLNQFVQQNGVINARTNYQVVAIMGPQSSGKSTLMNHVVRAWRTVRQGSSGTLLGCHRPLFAAGSTSTPVSICLCVANMHVLPCLAVWHWLPRNGRHDRQAADDQGCLAGEGSKD